MQHLFIRAERARLLMSTSSVYRMRSFWQREVLFLFFFSLYFPFDKTSLGTGCDIAKYFEHLDSSMAVLKHHHGDPFLWPVTQITARPKIATPRIFSMCWLLARRSCCQLPADHITKGDVMIGSGDINHKSHQLPSLRSVC